MTSDDERKGTKTMETMTKREIEERGMVVVESDGVSESSPLDLDEGDVFVVRETSPVEGYEAAGFLVEGPYDGTMPAGSYEVYLRERD